jgi:hypothetical protein
MSEIEQLREKLARWQRHLDRVRAGTMEPGFPFTEGCCAAMVALFTEQLAAGEGLGKEEGARDARRYW